jgi:sulfonate transport system substrate-binding protein
MRSAALLISLLILGTASAKAEVTLQLADQKGGERALLEAAGELKDLPYKVEWHEFPAAAPLAEALNAGAVDSGPIGDAPLVFAMAAGADIRAIGVNRSDATGTAVLALPDSPLDGPASLKGKRIATGRGSIGHYVVLAALKSAGLKQDDVTWRFLTQSDAKTALLTGSVDAWATWEPYTSVEEVTDHLKLAVSGQGLWSGLSFQAATATAIREKHEALSDLLQRLYRAQLWALDHEEDYAKQQAQVTGMPAEGVRRALHRRQQRWIPIDDGVVQSLQRVADTYAETGIIPHRFEVAPRFDRSFTPPAS